MPDVLNFLSENFHRGVGYESVNTARSALSALGIVLEGSRAGAHPLVSRFMRGVFNLRPSCPRYTETWDIRPVLIHLRSLFPVHQLSLKDLTLKLVMLMALTQAARVQTLHLLLHSNASVEQSCVSLLLEGNIKQCRPKLNVRLVKFLAYEPDARLCVILTLKEYFARTEALRAEFGNDNGKLLISYMKPHKYVSRDTVARWIKKTLALCDIDTNKYSAGSVRQASASTARALNVPVCNILAKAGWTQESTFAKYYNKEINGDSDLFQKAVLGAV